MNRLIKSLTVVALVEGILLMTAAIFIGVAVMVGIANFASDVSNTNTPAPEETTVYPEPSFSQDPNQPGLCTFPDGSRREGEPYQRCFDNGGHWVPAG